MSFVKKLVLKMANVGATPRKMQRYSRPFTVAVEGNIGSGKTTFIKHFNKFNNVALFSEPIDMWRNCDGHNLLVRSLDRMPLIVFNSCVFLGSHVQRSKKMELHLPVICTTYNAQTASEKSTSTNKADGEISVQC